VRGGRVGREGGPWAPEGAEGEPLTPSDVSRPGRLPLTSPSHASRLTAPTVGDALDAAARTLAGAGIPEARSAAHELYSSLVRRPTSAAWLDRDRPIPPRLREALATAAQRRATGWPLAYAAGVANFRGHWLEVDRRVLIPRPETEALVDLVLEWSNDARRGGSPLVVADACTGSGAIAIALALEASVPMRLVATDCSAEALAVARLNVETLRLGDRIALRHGDLLEPLAGEPLDAVVSNPPYVASAEWEGLEPSVRDYEPREALVAGADGLGAIRALLPQARAALRPGGLLALEVDARRAGDAAALAAAAGFVSCTVLQDLFGRPRYLRARRPADGCY
jgi:release factor glutamine methyltransferase